MLHITDGRNQICACHFPIAEWNGFHKWHYHIYGHIHNRMDDTYEFMRKRERALNIYLADYANLQLTLREI